MEARQAMKTRRSYDRPDEKYNKYILTRSSGFCAARGMLEDMLWSRFPLCRVFHLVGVLFVPGLRRQKK